MAFDTVVSGVVALNERKQRFKGGKEIGLKGGDEVMVGIYIPKSVL